MKLTLKLEAADVALGKRIASDRDKPAVKAAGEAGKLGDQGPLYALSAVILICGLLGRNRRLAETGLKSIIAVAAADAAKNAIKSGVKRTRPHVSLNEGRYERGMGGSEQKAEQSFPSGHMAGTVAFGRSLSRTYQAAGAVCGVASLGLGWSRMAKGSHWPGDILAGAVVGLAAESLYEQVAPHIPRLGLLKSRPPVLRRTGVPGFLIQNFTSRLAVPRQSNILRATAPAFVSDSTGGLARSSSYRERPDASRW
jgi:hypothetical protein